MSGRTDQVNARDIADITDSIIFEGAVAFGWLAHLHRRAERTLSRMELNGSIDVGTQQELKNLQKRLEGAAGSLYIFEKAVEKREAGP